MIAVWGTRGDAPLEAVGVALATRGERPVFIDEDQLEDAVVACDTYSLTPIELRTPDQRIDLARIGGVFARRVGGSRCSTDRAVGSSGAAASPDRDEIVDALHAWLDAMHGLVVNRPTAALVGHSKPLQLDGLREAGVFVPDTLVTTNPDDARAFVREHGRVVFKSASGTRTRASLWTPDHAALVGRVCTCPTLFQRYIPGRDVRVHVVDDRVFACEIDSGSVDYRYPAPSDRPAVIRNVELPSRIADRCVAVTRNFGLLLSGIDLRRTADDEWYALEVNTSPGFTAFEPPGASRVAVAIADLLLAMPAP